MQNKVFFINIIELFYLFTFGLLLQDIEEIDFLHLINLIMIILFQIGIFHSKYKIF
jgi:uncharacterized membrane protein